MVARGIQWLIGRKKKKKIGKEKSKKDVSKTGYSAIKSYIFGYALNEKDGGEGDGDHAPEARSNLFFIFELIIQDEDECDGDVEQDEDDLDPAVEEARLSASLLHGPLVLIRG